MEQEIILCTGCGRDARDPILPPAISCCPERDMAALPEFFKAAEKGNWEVRGLMLGWALRAKLRVNPPVENGGKW